MKRKLSLSVLFIRSCCISSRTAADDICTSSNNIFTVKLNLYASEFGYFQIEECGDTISPTIGIEINETYTFLQSDRSNYYHPLGFAYGPDGDHSGNALIEPPVSGTGSGSCEADSTCPAPMYFSGDKYLGKYSNNPDVAPITSGEIDFGLDVYEPLFKYPLPEWADEDPFSVKLRFNDDEYTQDLFYFCHVHSLMSGRIKLLKDGKPIATEDSPPLGYEYYTPSAFDESCGTWDLQDYQLPNSQCPAAFVCNSNSTDPVTQAYSTCTDAMDCHQFAGMTTGVSAQSVEALFIHQMVPHHQNAVNMAKALLKTGLVDCDDLSSESPPCVMHVILREIITNQNHQIQMMRDYLVEKKLPATDDCTVIIESKIVGSALEDSNTTNDNDAVSSSSDEKVMTTAVLGTTTSHVNNDRQWSAVIRLVLSITVLTVML